MKQFLKLKSIFVLLLISASSVAFAYEDFYIEINGIGYNCYSSGKAEVTFIYDDEWDVISYDITSVSFPATINCNGKTYTVTSIGSYTFYDCCALTSVTIPNTVTSIGDDAFYGCSKLTNVGITDLTAWCNISFSNEYSNPCFYAHRLLLNGEEIKNLVIPNTVTSIGSYTFKDCSGLTSVTIPNTVTSIDDNAFYGCYGLTNVGITDLTAWCNISFSNEYSNPCRYAHHLQLNGEEINDLVIPNSVNSIGTSAFSGCSGLTSVTIPNSVTSIGTSAFSGCSGLTSVTIPNYVTSIGTSAFSGCSGLTSVTIPNSVTSIGDNAFYNCSGLTSVDIIDLESWCNISFSNEYSNPCCYAHHLLLNGEEINDLVIPTTVTSIGNNTFSGCSGLTSVTIPNSVTSIGTSAFSGCSGLTSVVIPNSISSIGTSSFSGCSGLASVTIPNSITSIGEEVFSGCSGLTSIDIPNSVTSIGKWAFSGCGALNNVIIPNSVYYIGPYAFQYCDLSNLSIGKSVTYIGASAFYSCKLKDVYCNNYQPWQIQIGTDAFKAYNYSDRTLHVPNGMVEAYRTTGWNSYFGSIEEIGFNPVLATSIELNETSAVLAEGDVLQLTATVLPNNTTDKTVTWTSSNESVATVDDSGVVTAIAPGGAIITATTNDGSDLNATCTVNVTSSSVPNLDNILLVADTTMMHGDIIVLPVAMNNQDTFMAFQTDVFLPEGFTIVTDEDDEYVLTPSDRLTSDHMIMTQDVSNGAVRVICFTPNSQLISGHEGDLFYISVQVPDDAEGDYTVGLRNSLLTTTDYQELVVPDTTATITVKQFIPGDVNDSRTVNVTDIVVTAQYILEMNPNPFIFEAADMSGDGSITVTDVMLIAYLINHPAMNAPRRMPALDGCGDCMSAEGVAIMAGETRTVSILLNNAMDYSAFQLDLTLPAGLMASNFQLTDRAGSHAFDVNAIGSGKLRALCYSPALTAISGHDGALLTFDVTAAGDVKGDILVDGIELVTTGCQSVLLDGFAIGVNATTGVNEVAGNKVIDHIEYFNMAGQNIDRPESGVTLIVTTFTDGTRTTTKVIK